MCQSIPNPVIPDDAGPHEMCDYYIRKAIVSAMQDCLPQPVFVNALIKYAVGLTQTNCKEMPWREYIQSAYDYYMEEANRMEA